MTELVVPGRFRGPAATGNGGWTAGSLAALVEGCPSDHGAAWPTVEVTLRRPPPLDVAVPVVTSPAEARCSVAEAHRVDRDLTMVAAVPLAAARAAEESYPGLVSHPFPGCFVCGPDREEGDGLRIFPGPVTTPEGPGQVAATWTPHPSVAEDWHGYAGATPRASLPVTWAALDCVGGWAGDLAERAMVLGRMTARLAGLPRIGQAHVVVGRRLGGEGRKTFTASALYDADGAEVGRAEHVWIAVDPAGFNRASGL